MLPDYHRVKPEVEKRLRTLMRKRAEAQCLPLAKIKPVVLHEGTGTYLVRADGSTDDTPMVLNQAKIEITADEASEEPPHVLAQKFFAAADELAQQVSRHFYARVSDAATEVGNVVSLAGNPLTADAILDIWEKLLVDFDEHGNPEWPTLVTGPKSGQAVEAAFRQLEADPEYRKRLEQLINRKREEYRARESNRRLVD